jgi:CBS domain-containing protein
MLNSEKFLQAFANIEKRLRRMTSCKKSVPFFQVIDRAAERDPAVRRYKDDLKEFADLRNAIVHERTDGHPIAEPNSRAVREMERIEVHLTSPPKVLPIFQKEVVGVEVDTPISQAVALMKAGAFSQLPVNRSGRFVGLLTANTVTRWLGASVKDEIVSLTETMVGEVLRHTEDGENHVFLNGEASLFAVLSKFDDFGKRGKPLDAILLTYDGKTERPLLGIITIYDVPKILAELA